VSPGVVARMELQPRLVAVRTPRQPRGVVLVLHGGASRREAVAVSPTQLSVLRMVPIARRLARSRGLAVYRLLNSRRGWDHEDTPLADVRWALVQVRERYGDVPVVLVGHSLGGRAALLATTEPGVAGAVALNAYLLPGDESVDPAGRRIRFVHGTDDRIASFERARAVAARLGRCTDVDLRVIEGGKHAMLRHGRAFDRAAADFAASALSDDSRPVSSAPPD
jgi:pimeloyl-ACP methyl ester carboxylesterase